MLKDFLKCCLPVDSPIRMFTWGVIIVVNPILRWWAGKKSRQNGLASDSSQKEEVAFRPSSHMWSAHVKNALHLIWTHWRVSVDLFGSRNHPKTLIVIECRFCFVEAEQFSGLQAVPNTWVVYVCSDLLSHLFSWSLSVWLGHELPSYEQARIQEDAINQRRGSRIPSFHTNVCCLFLGTSVWKFGPTNQNAHSVVNPARLRPATSGALSHNFHSRLSFSLFLKPWFLARVGKYLTMPTSSSWT